MRRVPPVLFCVLLSTAAAFACGTERWPVKVLTDADHGKIHQKAQTETIANLIVLEAPQGLKTHENTRFDPVELTTYKVDALLLGYRLEDDEDFHLVIAARDNTQQTMIAEIPSSNCLRDAKLADAVQKFRDRIVAKFGKPGKNTRRLPHPVKITLRGVGFFDFRHGQDGLAPNGIELHPVLGMSFPK